MRLASKLSIPSASFTDIVFDLQEEITMINTIHISKRLCILFILKIYRYKSCVSSRSNTLNKNLNAVVCACLPVFTLCLSNVAPAPNQPKY
jgi:hypothetical protein